jgi:hypothetical protein
MNEKRVFTLPPCETHAEENLLENLGLTPSCK